MGECDYFDTLLQKYINRIFECFIQWTIDYYLGKFIDIDSQQLSLGILTGKLHLRNVRIKPDVVDRLNLGFSLINGVIGSIRISIPLFGLRWSEWSVELDNVVALFKSAPLDLSSCISTPEKKNEWKKKKLNVLEQQWIAQKLLANKQMSWTSSAILYSLLNRLVVRIRNIHFRYEDDIEENHFAIGLRLSDIEYRQQSMEEKLINFTNFRIYFLASIRAENDETFLQQFHQQTENVEEFLRKMTLEETMLNLNDNAIHLLSPHTFNLNVIKNNKDESLKTIDECRFHIQSITEVPLKFNFHYIQINLLLKCFNKLKNVHERRRFVQCRPSTFNKQCIGEWWRYLSISIIGDRLINFLIRKNLRNHIIRMSKYSKLYKRYLIESKRSENVNKSLLEKIENQLTEMESIMEYDTLVIIRKAVFESLSDKIIQMVNENRSEQQSTTWTQWWNSISPLTLYEEDTTTQSPGLKSIENIDSEIIDFIRASILEDSVMHRDAVLTRFDIQFNQISFIIHQSDDLSRNIELKLDNCRLCMDVMPRYEANIINLIVNDICLRTMSSYRYIDLITNKSKSTIEKKPVIHLTFESNTLEMVENTLRRVRNCRYRCQLFSSGLSIHPDVNVIDQILNFKNFLTNQTELMKSSNWNSSSIHPSNHTNDHQSLIDNIRQFHNSSKFIIDIEAPEIVMRRTIPKKKDYFVLIIDLGNLHITNDSHHTLYLPINNFMTASAFANKNGRNLRMLRTLSSIEMLMEDDQDETFVTPNCSPCHSFEREKTFPNILREHQMNDWWDGNQLEEMVNEEFCFMRIDLKKTQILTGNVVNGDIEELKNSSRQSIKFLHSFEMFIEMKCLKKQSIENEHFLKFYGNIDNLFFFMESSKCEKILGIFQYFYYNFPEMSITKQSPNRRSSEQQENNSTLNSMEKQFEFQLRKLSVQLANGDESIAELQLMDCQCNSRKLEDGESDVLFTMGEMLVVDAMQCYSTDYDLLMASHEQITEVKQIEETKEKRQTNFISIEFFFTQQLIEVNLNDLNLIFNLETIALIVALITTLKKKFENNKKRFYRKKLMMIDSIVPTTQTRSVVEMININIIMNSFKFLLCRNGIMGNENNEINENYLYGNEELMENTILTYHRIDDRERKKLKRFIIKLARLTIRSIQISIRSNHHNDLELVSEFQSFFFDDIISRFTRRYIIPTKLNFNSNEKDIENNYKSSLKEKWRRILSISNNNNQQQQQPFIIQLKLKNKKLFINISLTNFHYNHSSRIVYEMGKFKDQFNTIFHYSNDKETRKMDEYIVFIEPNNNLEELQIVSSEINFANISAFFPIYDDWRDIIFNDNEYFIMEIENILFQMSTDISLNLLLSHGHLQLMEKQMKLNVIDKFSLKLEKTNFLIKINFLNNINFYLSRSIYQSINCLCDTLIFRDFDAIDEHRYGHLETVSMKETLRMSDTLDNIHLKIPSIVIHLMSEDIDGDEQNIILKLQIYDSSIVVEDVDLYMKKIKLSVKHWTVLDCLVEKDEMKYQKIKNTNCLSSHQSTKYTPIESDDCFLKNPKSRQSFRTFVDDTDLLQNNESLMKTKNISNKLRSVERRAFSLPRSLSSHNYFHPTKKMTKVPSNKKVEKDNDFSSIIIDLVIVDEKHPDYQEKYRRNHINFWIKIDDVILLFNSQTMALVFDIFNLGNSIPPSRKSIGKETYIDIDNHVEMDERMFVSFRMKRFRFHVIFPSPQQLFTVKINRFRSKLFVNQTDCRQLKLIDQKHKIYLRETNGRRSEEYTKFSMKMKSMELIDNSFYSGGKIYNKRLFHKMNEELFELEILLISHDHYLHHNNNKNNSNDIKDLLMNKINQKFVDDRIRSERSVDIIVEGKLNELIYIHSHLLIKQLLNLIDEFTGTLNVMDQIRSAQSFEQLQQHFQLDHIDMKRYMKKIQTSKRISYNIQISSPIIIIPMNNSSTKCLVFEPGQFLIVNEFKPIVSLNHASHSSLTFEENIAYIWQMNAIKNTGRPNSTIKKESLLMINDGIKPESVFERFRNRSKQYSKKSLNDFSSKTLEDNIYCSLIDVMQIQLNNTKLLVCEIDGNYENIIRKSESDTEEIFNNTRSLIDSSYSIKFVILRNLDVSRGTQWLTSDANFLIYSDFSRLTLNIEQSDYLLIRRILSENIGANIPNHSFESELGKRREVVGESHYRNLSKDLVCFQITNIVVDDLLKMMHRTFQIDLLFSKIIINLFESHQKFASLNCENCILSYLKNSDESDQFNFHVSSVKFDDSRSSNNSEMHKNKFCSFIQLPRDGITKSNGFEMNIFSNNNHEVNSSYMINEATVIIIPELLMKLKEFILMEIDKDEMNKKKDNEIHFINKKEKIQINLNNFELVFIEDLTDIESMAIVLELNGQLSKKMMILTDSLPAASLSLNLDKIQLSSIKMHSTEDNASTIFLEEMSLLIDIIPKIDMERSFEYGENWEIVMNPIIVRLSYHDVRMIMSIITSLKESTALHYSYSCGTDLKKGEKDEMKSSNLLTVLSNNEKSKIVIYCEGMSICLIDDLDSSDIPLGELILEDIKLNLHTPILYNRHGKLNPFNLYHSRFALSIMMSIYYYNRLESGWEPLLEPWSIDVHYKQLIDFNNETTISLPRKPSTCNMEERLKNVMKKLNIQHSTLAINESRSTSLYSSHSNLNTTKLFNIRHCLLLHSDEMMNWNLTQSIYQLIQTTSEKLKKIDLSKQTVSNERQPFIPFQIRNFTGCKLYFSQFSGSSKNESCTWITVNNRNKCSFSFYGLQIFKKTNNILDINCPNHSSFLRKFSRFDAYIKKKNYLISENNQRILIKLDGWKCIDKPINVDRIGTMMYIIKKEVNDSFSDKREVFAKILCNIRMNEQAMKIINIQSALLFYNHLPFSLTVEGGKECVLHEISPNELYSIPIQYANSECKSMKSINIYRRKVIGGDRLRILSSLKYHDALLRDSYCTNIRINEKSNNYSNIIACSNHLPIISRFDRLNLPCHLIELMSPIIIYNLLPFDIKFQLHESSASPLYGECKANDSIDFTQIHLPTDQSNILLKMKLMVESMPFQTTTNFDEITSITFELNRDDMLHSTFSNLIQNETYSIVDEQRRILYLNIRISRNSSTMSSTSLLPLTLSISCDYWFLNKTGLPLIFQQMDASCRISVGQMDDNECARQRSPLLFSFSDMNAPPFCRMRIGNRLHDDGNPIWSKEFAITSGTVCWRSLKVDRRNNIHEYFVGIHATKGNGLLRHTTIVSFTSRYIILNQSSFDIQLSQLCFINSTSNLSSTTLVHDNEQQRTPHNSNDQLVIMAQSSTAFHWSRSDLDMLLSLRIRHSSNDDYVGLWTKGFRIDKPISSQLVLRSICENVSEFTKNNSKYYRQSEHLLRRIRSDLPIDKSIYHHAVYMKIDIVLHDGSFHVMVTDLNRDAPLYRIDNYSNVNIYIRQFEANVNIHDEDRYHTADIDDLRKDNSKKKSRKFSSSSLNKKSYKAFSIIPHNFLDDYSSRIQSMKSIPIALDQPMQPPLFSIAVNSSSYVICDPDNFGEINSICFDNPFYIIVKDQLINVKDKKNMLITPLVLDVNDLDEIIITSLQTDNRRQLWKQLSDGRIVHMKSVKFDNKLSKVLDMERKDNSMKLVINISNEKRNSTQKWIFQRPHDKESNSIYSFQSKIDGEDEEVENKTFFLTLANNSQKYYVDIEQGKIKLRLSKITTNIRRFSLRKQYPGSNKLRVFIRTDGPTRVIEIIDSSDIPSNNNNNNNSLMKSLYKQRSNSDVRLLSNTNVRYIHQIDIKLEKGIGLSLISRQTIFYEILYFVMEHVRTYLTILNDEINVCLYVNRLIGINQFLDSHRQIFLQSDGNADCSYEELLEERHSGPVLDGAIMNKVCVTNSNKRTKEKNKSGRNTSDIPHLNLCFSLVRSVATNYDNILTFNEFIISSPKLNIVIIEDFLWRLISFILHLKLPTDYVKEVNYINHDNDYIEDVVNWKKDVETIKTFRDHHLIDVVQFVIRGSNEISIYFNNLQISRIILKLSMLTAPKTKMPSDLLQIKLKFGVPLINFENANIQLEKISLCHVQLTSSLMIHHLIEHYRRELKLQALMILGTVDFLGSPFGLLSDVHDGLTSFFRTGDFGSLLQNVTHGVAKSAGKITNSLSEGISWYITLDDQHQRTREWIKQMHNQKGFDQMIGGTLGLGYGLASGLTSILSQTVNGASQSGFSGLITGFGKGLIGSISKPVVGVLDFGSGIAHAVRDTAMTRNETIYSDECIHTEKDYSRISRYPRVCYSLNSCLPLYNQLDALSQMKLYELLKSINLIRENILSHVKSIYIYHDQCSPHIKYSLNELKKQIFESNSEDHSSDDTNNLEYETFSSLFQSIDFDRNYFSESSLNCIEKDFEELTDNLSIYSLQLIEVYLSSIIIIKNNILIHIMVTNLRIYLFEKKLNELTIGQKYEINETDILTRGDQSLKYLSAIIQLPEIKHVQLVEEQDTKIAIMKKYSHFVQLQTKLNIKKTFKDERKFKIKIICRDVQKVFTFNALSYEIALNIRETIVQVKGLYDDRCQNVSGENDRFFHSLNQRM
ncbi:hypothetical protein SNEBB_004090 [Seison nebaliae]|nr:hypothetical protein SNEBB_004090 [Seison nebaliae]